MTGCWLKATPLCAVLDGWVVSTSFAAGPGLTTTAAICVTATPLIVADTVFDSATVELSVPVATPLAFVVAPGCVTVLPVPLALSTTVAPATGLPSASRAVTVIVDVPLPAVIGVVAATLDCAPETVLACTTTVAVCVIATPLIVADTVFDSATAELNVPVATPSPLVGPVGWVSVFARPVAARTTVAPGIGLPKPSLAVTVIVDVPVPAAIGDVAVSVDWPAETGPGFTTIVAVAVTATPPIVADTTFEPTVVDDRVPVATPFASVGPAGCVSAVFTPVAASTTVAPWIGLPLASFAVTVIVEVPLPAVMGDVAVTVDCVAETAPAVTSTVAVWVIATELMVADTVFDPAAVEASVPVATPLPSVVPTSWVSVLPVVGVAASVTVAPSMRLPNASLAVTVIVEAPLPVIIGDVATTVDWLADTVPVPAMVNAGDVPPSVPLDAVSVYPVPALSMLKVENVATPPTAATGPPPVSVPPPGFVPIARVTFPVNVVAVCPSASCAVTFTAGVIAAPAVVLLGGTVNTRWVGVTVVTLKNALFTPERPDDVARSR